MWYDNTGGNFRDNIHLDNVFFENLGNQFCKAQFGENGMTLKGQVPMGPVTGKFSISNEEIRAGAGVGVGKAGYVGGFLNYDLKKNQLGAGVEGDILGVVGGEALGSYNWNEDKLDLKLSVSVLDNKFDLAHVEIKDVAQNTIGKPLDAIMNGFDDFKKHVSPQERKKAKFVQELQEQAANVRDIGGLGDLIRKAGENEYAWKGSEASYEVHKAQFNYLTQLDDRVSQNTENIKIHAQILGEHEERLNQHDVILSQHSQQLAAHEAKLQRHDYILSVHDKMLKNHEFRLNRHEKILNMHSALLKVHEQRLNRHERILNIHENRLNQHESILNLHGSILREHENRLNQHAMAINDLYGIVNEHNKILNAHGQKINELDQRMYNVENNVMELNKQVSMHANLLSQHGEILESHGKSLKELYTIANDQQIQLNKQNELINEHQKAIVDLFHNYHDLKDRVDRDEKVINKLGDELNKVIKHSVETRDIVDGLVHQTQIHRDLIVQNSESINEIKNEMRNQINIILSHQQVLKDFAKELDLHRAVIEQHDKDIKQLKEFVVDLSKEIGNIYNEIDELKNKVNNIEGKLKIEMDKKINLRAEKEKIERRVNNLIDKVENFNKKEQSDFIKCMYMAVNNRNYNLEQMEIVARNISNLR